MSGGPIRRQRGAGVYRRAASQPQPSNQNAGILGKLKDYISSWLPVSHPLAEDSMAITIQQDDNNYQQQRQQQTQQHRPAALPWSPSPQQPSSSNQYQYQQEAPDVTHAPSVHHLQQQQQQEAERFQSPNNTRFSPPPRGSQSQQRGLNWGVASPQQQQQQQQQQHQYQQQGYRPNPPQSTSTSSEHHVDDSVIDPDENLRRAIELKVSKSGGITAADYEYYLRILREKVIDKQALEEPSYPQTRTPQLRPQPVYTSPIDAVPAMRKMSQQQRGGHPTTPRTATNSWAAANGSSRRVCNSHRSLLLSFSSFSPTSIFCLLLFQKKGRGLWKNETHSLSTSSCCTT
jgi:hypothetical protein